MFYGCTALTRVFLPANNTGQIDDIWSGSSITDIELEQGFCKPLNISSATLLSRETMVDHIINSLGNTGGTTVRLTLGTTNRAKLTAADILIATNKGYTVI